MVREAEASITGKVAFNTLVQVGGKVIVLATAIALTSILTRFLGQEGYGDYTIVFAYLGVASLFIDFGLQTIAVREISMGKHGLEEIVGNVFTLKALSASSVLLLGNLFVFLLPYPRVVKFGVLIASLSTWLGALGAPVTIAFQARLQMQYAEAMTVVARLTVLILSFLITVTNRLHGGSQGSAIFYWLVAVNVVASALGLLIGYNFARRRFSFQPAFDRALCWRILLDALPLAIVILLSEALFRVDTFLLSLFRSSSEVGVYGVSHKVLELVLLFPGLFMASVFPILSRFVKRDRLRFKTAMQKSLDFMAIMGIPMVAGAVVLAPGIIGLLGGIEFEGSILPLRVLIFAGLFGFLSSVFVYGLIAEGQQGELFWVFGLSVALNVFLNLLFIPSYGYLAAASITVFSQFFCLIFLTYLALRRRLFPLSLGAASKAVLASLAMVLGLMALKDNVILAVPLGTILYFSILYLLRGFDKELVLALIRASRENI